MKNLVIRMERTTIKAGAFTVAVTKKELEELKKEADVLIIWERDLLESERVHTITGSVILK